MQSIPTDFEQYFNIKSIKKLKIMLMTVYKTKIIHITYPVSCERLNTCDYNVLSIRNINSCFPGEILVNRLSVYNLHEYRNSISVACIHIKSYPVLSWSLSSSKNSSTSVISTFLHAFFLFLARRDFFRGTLASIFSFPTSVKRRVH